MTDYQFESEAVRAAYQREVDLDTFQKDQRARLVEAHHGNLAGSLMLPAFTPRSHEELLETARRRAAKQQAYRATPEGRLLSAMRAIQTAAEAVRACCDRGFDDVDNTLFAAKHLHDIQATLIKAATALQDVALDALGD